MSVNIIIYFTFLKSGWWYRWNYKVAFRGIHGVYTGSKCDFR